MTRIPLNFLYALFRPLSEHLKVDKFDDILWWRVKTSVQLQSHCISTSTRMKQVQTIKIKNFIFQINQNLTQAIQVYRFTVVELKQFKFAVCGDLILFCWHLPQRWHRSCAVSRSQCTCKAGRGQKPLSCQSCGWKRTHPWQPQWLDCSHSRKCVRAGNKTQIS